MSIATSRIRPQAYSGAQLAFLKAFLTIESLRSLELTDFDLNLFLDEEPVGDERG